MQKITPFLWFDGKAEEAANFYISLFENSKILGLTRYGEEGPGLKGAVMTVRFQLAGQIFDALNGGPVFTFTPSISFYVNCKTVGEVDALWAKLSPGGSVLMPLNKYPFSEKYGWVTDPYGISWQLFHNANPFTQKIAPCLMFGGSQNGKAEAAIKDYMSLFENSKVIMLARYGNDQAVPEASVMHAEFALHGQEFIAMDSHLEHTFTFTPAISFFVDCQTQEEVDRLWEKLSESGRKDQCGWLQDKYGVSWQIVPSILPEYLQDPDPEKSGRVMKAMLKMTKLDIAQLTKAYNG
jgi:predicted 3-demethylubiquinone-9 3-methyltransferase (glyoxalase superfamily)